MNENSPVAPGSSPHPAWILLALFVAGLAGGIAVGVASGVVFTGFEWADAVAADNTGANASSERFRLGVVILFGLTVAVISALVLRALLPRMAGLLISFEGALAAMIAGSIVAAGLSSLLLLSLGGTDPAVFSPWQGFELLTISFSLLALAVEYAVVQTVARPLHAPEPAGPGSHVPVAILVSSVLLVGAVVLVSRGDAGSGGTALPQSSTVSHLAYFAEIREAEQRLIEYYAGLWLSVSSGDELELREQVLAAEATLRRRADRLEKLGSPDSSLDQAHAAFTGALQTFADALFLVRDRELSGGRPSARLSEAALISELDEALRLLADAGFDVDPLAWIVARGDQLDSSGPTNPTSPTNVELPPQLATG